MALRAHLSLSLSFYARSTKGKERKRFLLSGILLDINWMPKEKHWIVAVELRHHTHLFGVHAKRFAAVEPQSSGRRCYWRKSFRRRIVAQCFSFSISTTVATTTRGFSVSKERTSSSVVDVDETTLVSGLCGKTFGAHVRTPGRGTTNDDNNSTNNNNNNNNNAPSDATRRHGLRRVGHRRGICR